MEFILELKTENGEDICDEDAENLYSDILMIIQNGTENYENENAIIQEVAYMLSSRGFIYDYNELEQILFDEFGDEF